MQNRQLIGYKISTQPMLDYHQKITSADQGLDDVNLDLKAVATFKCEACELLMEHHKAQIRNRHAHGRPQGSTHERQLMDFLLQNRPTC